MTGTELGDETHGSGAAPAGAGSDSDCDVVIVGCGPVGSVLAILLGQLGRSVIVLERWPEPYPLPRAVHFDHEVGRIFQSCGIGDELRGISEPTEIYEWRNAAGTTLLRFGRIGDGPSGWPVSSMFCQPDMERLLEERVHGLPGVEVRRGVDVVAIEQSADHVEVLDAAGGSVSGRFVVGCDGANSTARGAVGIEWEDLGFFFDWLIVDVILDEERVFDPLNLQICDPARPTTAVSGGPGRRRWEFMRLPGEPLDELTAESRAWELLAPWDVTPDAARLERHAVYTFQARYAEEWRAGRVLLAGDAAHLMPPFAGQGMCSGIRDAANLAWKLDLVLGGAAGEGLLDTYTEERLPSAREAIDFSISLGQVICVPDPGEAALRDEAMAAAVTDEPMEVPDLPGIGSGLLDPASVLAGGLFVQGREGERLFDDAHGVGWRLVGVGGAASGASGSGAVNAGGPERVTESGAILNGDLADWFASIGGEVVVVAEPDDTLLRWFREHEVGWVLERPDFHVYGTAVDVADAGRLVASLRQRLAGTRGLATT